MFEWEPVSVRVSGELACFTRPEMKVERVTYPVMTPSAARGILEAIFWKPEFRWCVRRIAVLKPIRHISFMRNEVASLVPVKGTGTWRNRGEHTRFFADDDRQQRHTLALRDVAYEIAANVLLAPHAQDAHPAKYRDQFRRRVERGACYQRPYLGCREFAARFEPPRPDEEPIDHSDDLGRVLFDVVHEEDKDGTTVRRPVFFAARLKDGSLTIPDEIHQEVWLN